MKVIYVEATKEQKKLLKLIKKGVSDNEKDPLIKVENALERSLRWRQVVGGWLPQQDPMTEKTELVPLKENPKADALFDLIPDILESSKFIIWSPFTHEIDYIYDVLSKKYGPNTVARYYGATKKGDIRSEIEDRYCNDPEFKFFIGNPAAAGLGLTLISGIDDVMIYYSGTDHFIDRAQSEDRAHRIGQSRTMTIIDLVMEKTIDEAIILAHHEKMSVEEYIMKRMAEGSNSIELEG